MLYRRQVTPEFKRMFIRILVTSEQHAGPYIKEAFFRRFSIGMDIKKAADQQYLASYLYTDRTRRRFNH